VKTIVVGGGVQGLACAYALARRGVGPLTILEARRIGYGASVRNSGGARAQFRNEPNIRLGKRSLELLENLSAELGYQIMFHRGGYMYLHYTEADAAQAEKDVRLQNSLCVPTRLISPDQARRIVPGLNVEGIRVVKYNPHDVSCHHDALLWGYLRALKRLGVEVRQGAKVTKLVKQGGSIGGAVVDGAVLQAEQVIVAAGTWGPQLLKTAGVEVPVTLWRREQLVTTPIKHFLDTFVIDRRLGVSFHQSIHGEVLGGGHVPLEGPSTSWHATRPLIETWCQGVYKLFPPLSRASVLRQWAGTRGFTPDGTPIFGPVADVPGLWMICGQSGTGLMLSPAIAEAIAQEFSGLSPQVDWAVYSPRRFETGDELWERTPET
jgi:sarcosine oxidase subunit beta